MRAQLLSTPASRSVHVEQQAERQPVYFGETYLGTLEEDAFRNPGVVVGRNPYGANVGVWSSKAAALVAIEAAAGPPAGWSMTLGATQSFTKLDQR